MKSWKLSVLCTVAVLLLLAAAVVLFSLLPYLQSRRLTKEYGAEFQRFSEESGLTVNRSAVSLCVLRYSDRVAKVSYLSDDGRQESICTFHRTDRRASWRMDSKRIVSTNKVDSLLSGTLRRYFRMLGC